MAVVLRLFLILASSALAASPLLAAHDAGELAEGGAVETAPVEIDGRELFRVRGAASLAAEVRADRIARRIEAIAANPSVAPDSLQVSTAGEYMRIAAGEQPAVTLVQADADLMQVSLTVLADLYRQRIVEAIEDYRRFRHPEQLMRNALLALAATFALALLLLLLMWATRRLDVRLERRFRRRMEVFEAQSFELVRAEQIRGALRGILGGVRVVVLVALVLAYLQFVLALFPWTYGYSRGLLDVVLGPLETMARAILRNVPNLIFLAVLFLVLRFLLRLLRLFFEAVGRGAITLARFDREWALPTYKIARLAVIAFGLVVAYPYIPGSESAAFKGISLFLGVVFSLSSSSALSNIIAGYNMTYRRAFRVGDRVKIGDTIGEVIEMRLQVTHLRSLKNEEVIIPNSLILNTEVVNYTSLAKERGLILHTVVGIGYETPWRQVEAMLLLAAERTAGLPKEPAPFVLQRKLGDFAVEYELNVHTHEANSMLALYTALHRNILDVFNEYGVQIMTPAYVSDPTQAKLVAKEQWYVPPAHPQGGA